MENSKQTPLDFDEVTFREFSEFNVDVMRAAESGHGGIASIDVNEVSFNSVDFDARFRSIQAVNPASLSEFAPRHYEATMVAGPPSLGRDSGPTVNCVTDVKTHIEVVDQSSEPFVPEKPFYVVPSSFVCYSSIGDIKRNIDHALNQMFEVSYKFSPTDCRWEAVYLRGPTRCKFEVNIYRESRESYVIEGNRLSGDAFPFRNIFIALKSSILPDSAPGVLAGRTSFSDSIALPAGDDLSLEDSRQALNAIVEMARSRMVDTRAEAAKIFCDLSLQQNMQLLLCDAGCLGVLVDLLQVEFDFCNQHAACALANLSSSRSCQDILVNNSAFLPTLMKYAVDGPHDSSEMRRECTRMLANICAGLAPRVVGNLGVDTVSSWVGSVAHLKDERLRMHAERARQYILPCM